MTAAPTSVDPSLMIASLFRGKNCKAVAPAIIGIVDELTDYWPLTVRQVFYQLVSQEIIENTESAYKNVSTVLTKLRRNNLVGWDAIEDRSRRLIDKRGVTDLEHHNQSIS